MRNKAVINDLNAINASAQERYVKKRDGNRNLLKLDGANYATHAYDIANRLTSITNSADSTNITFAYDNADRLTSRGYPNGVTTTYEYDGMSRLTRLKDTSATATLFDRQYSYNTANQISQIVEPSVSRTFAYDNIDRLLSVTNPTSGNESYLFDVVGNRTSSHRSNTYSYQPFNRVTSTQTATYAYDSNGNMVSKSEGSKRRQYAWDYENRVTSVSDRKTRQRQVYDALGRRVMTYGGPKGSTKYTYDGLDVVRDDDSVSGITKYQNGLGIDDKLKLTNGGTTKYFLQDHLGSTVALTNSSGAVTEQTTYDSFGNPTNAGVQSRYLFTGREFDSFTGLQFSRARFYDANLGRFISEDPIGFSGGDVNLFGYVKSNAINRIDPLGLYDEAGWEAVRQAARAAPQIGSGAAAGAGALAGLGAGGATATAVAVVGLAAGYGIGYYPGQWTANSPYNPFVYGPLNPFGTPYNPYAMPQPMPQTATARPTCQAAPSTPFYQTPPLKRPFSDPDDDDPDDRRCKPQFESDNRVCRGLARPADRAACFAQAMERYASCLAGRPLPYFPW